MKFRGWGRRLFKIRCLGNTSFRKRHWNGIIRRTPCEDKEQDTLPGKKKAEAKNHIPFFYLGTGAQRMVIYGRDEWKRPFTTRKNLGAQYNIVYFGMHNK